MTAPRPIHPFPARMAPEIALDECRGAKKDAVVLDPMSGSGTSLRIASDRGLTALGFDLDPLAVLISRVWTRKLSSSPVNDLVEEIIEEATASGGDPRLPWIDDDPATKAFIDFWFATKQKVALRRLAGALFTRIGPASDACRVALSRLIITKDRGASKARDTSHSRPHVVYEDEDYDVAANFRRSVVRLGKILDEAPPSGNAKVRLGDARKLSNVDDSSVDIVVTSPPYLNAIDYMRGHRLSLVWLGYSLDELSRVRSSAIGTERKADVDMTEAEEITRTLQLSRLDPRSRSMVDRYAHDVSAMVREISRSLKTGGTAVFAVGNSCLKGCYVDNATILSAAAQAQRLSLLSRIDRDLPAAKRYLPPPSDGTAASDLSNRMRSETVLKFRKEPLRKG